MTNSLILKEKIKKFTVRHNSMQRPLALVTSGGTSCALEVHSVRFLDNFSTGYRGAVSVEEFINHGYAVIHLWREGSASPYGHVLSKLFGCRMANHGLGIDSLAVLFDQNDNISVRKDFFNCSKLQKVRREHSRAVLSGLILTVPFQTVEEYISKLQICAEGMKNHGVLGLVYLAAAVSDYYIPLEERSLHKMKIKQNTLTNKNKDYDDENTLTIRLRPVLKCISLLRTLWAPNAFCVTFKLETDQDLLEERCYRSMIKNDVHIVVGNILNTRHEWVLVMENNSDNDRNFNDDYMKNISVKNTKLIGKPKNYIEIKSKNDSTKDILENHLISHLVKKHQNYIDKYTIGSVNNVS